MQVFVIKGRIKQKEFLIQEEQRDPNQGENTYYKQKSTYVSEGLWALYARCLDLSVLSVLFPKSEVNQDKRWQASNFNQHKQEHCSLITMALPFWRAGWSRNSRTPFWQLLTFRTLLSFRKLIFLHWNTDVLKIFSPLSKTLTLQASCSQHQLALEQLLH